MPCGKGVGVTGRIRQTIGRKSWGVCSDLVQADLPRTPDRRSDAPGVVSWPSLFISYLVRLSPTRSPCRIFSDIITKEVTESGGVAYRLQNVNTIITVSEESQVLEESEEISRFGPIVSLA